MENLSNEKIFVSLQIYIKDKLLDQNAWNCDTENFNLYPSISNLCLLASVSKSLTESENSGRWLVEGLWIWFFC